MKQFLSWTVKRLANGVVTGLFAILTISGVVFAINWPSSGGHPVAPTGEVVGGKFTQYFTNMFGSDCASWGALKWFTASGMKVCTTKVSQADTLISEDCWAGKVLRWFTSTGARICSTSPAFGGGIGNLIPASEKDANNASIRAAALSGCSLTLSNTNGDTQGTVSAKFNVTFNASGQAIFDSLSCGGSGGGNYSITNTNTNCTWGFSRFNVEAFKSEQFVYGISASFVDEKISGNTYRGSFTVNGKTSKTLYCPNNYTLPNYEAVYVIR